MNKEINYKELRDTWENFFIGKGFKVIEETENEGNYFVCLTGSYNGSRELIITIYAGNYRTNTATRGCIGVDFSNNYNKLSQCPVYLDLGEDVETGWKAIRKLLEIGVDFPEKYEKMVKTFKGDFIPLKRK